MPARYDITTRRAKALAKAEVLRGIEQYGGDPGQYTGEQIERAAEALFNAERDRFMKLASIDVNLRRRG